MPNVTELLVRDDSSVTGPEGSSIPLIEVVTYVCAILVALAVGATAFAVLGANPLTAYGTVIHNSLGSVSALSQTLNKTTPLLLGSAAVALSLRGGFLNLGVAGQMYAGAICAMWAAFSLEGAPRIIEVIVPLVAAAIGGGLFAAVAAVLRHLWSVNELFVTVMLNFVGMYAADWLATRVWSDPVTGNAVSKPIPAAAQLPTYGHFGGHIGIFIAIAVAIAIQIWLSHSRRGYELNAMSANPVASKMAGISPLLMVLLALAGGGVLAGLGGGIELTGAQFVLFNGLSANYGFMSVLAAVLARRNAILCIPVAFVLAGLIVGTNALQATIQLPASAVLLLEGLVVLTILIGESLAKRSKLLARLSAPASE